MHVLKFGGSSVATASAIQKVLQIVSLYSKNDTTTYVVVSALGGVTDLLLEAGKRASENNETYKTVLEDIETRHLEVIRELIDVTNQASVISHVKMHLNLLESLCEGVFLLGELSPRTRSVIASFGEILSSYIISKVAIDQGIDALLKDSRELIITEEHSKASSLNTTVTYKNIQEFKEQNSHKIVIFPGFVAKTSSGEATTLGRGGSDYTAAILAAAINAKELLIYTDVSGMFTANPRVVKQAKPVAHVSYQEAMELSHFGAKVIYPPTIQPVLQKNIPIWIKNTFAPDDIGTYITQKADDRKATITGISHIENISLLTLEGGGMVGVPGVSKRLFETLFLENINVVLITQASSEHSICLVVNTNDSLKAKKAIEKTFELEISKGIVQPVRLEDDISIVALVGDNMVNHQGISGKMFSTLGKNNINVRAIAQGASERNISAVIAKKNTDQAINALHETFFEEDIKTLHLFITGVGNVGGKLIEQLHQQKQYLKDNLGLQIKVVALSNSKKMVFNQEGIDLNSWEAQLLAGETSSIDGFFEKTAALNLRNSIFVDNTATEHVSKVYRKYLAQSIGVVTCNKIACADDYVNYKELKTLSKTFNAPFLFETNVGAGLPIIDTLNNLIASGDRVRKIQAVLSGSLNFIFNNYQLGTTFHSIVCEAQKQGYTEPDPKIDLSGIDVARKILILARESGHVLELSDLVNNAFLPQQSLETTTVEDFLESIKLHEPHFSSILQEANAQQCRLKYVAQFENGKASVGLQNIAPNHPFYNLEGSDNIVLFYTDRYSEQPLIVKGAGAGADVTASGIFADIIRIGKK